MCNIIIEQYATESGYKYLTVKTLAETHSDSNYQKTRLFYEYQGFVPLEVLPDLWSPEHPCLLMVKPL
jgi:hypothetical protein